MFSLKTILSWSYFRLYVWQDKISRFSVLGSAVLVLAHLVLIIYPGSLLRKSSELVAIRYNIYFGVDRVGELWQLWFYPALAFFILVLNTFLSLLVAQKSKLILYYINAITTVLLLLNLLTFIFVLILNLEFIRR